MSTAPKAELPSLFDDTARSIARSTTREALRLEPHIRRFALTLRGSGVSLDGVRAQLRALLAESRLHRLDAPDFGWVEDQVLRWAADAYRRGD